MIARAYVWIVAAGNDGALVGAYPVTVDVEQEITLTHMRGHPRREG